MQLQYTRQPPITFFRKYVNSPDSVDSVRFDPTTTCTVTSHPLMRSKPIVDVHTLCYFCNRPEVYYNSEYGGQQSEINDINDNICLSQIKNYSNLTKKQQLNIFVYSLAFVRCIQAQAYYITPLCLAAVGYIVWCLQDSILSMNIHVRYFHRINFPFISRYRIALLRILSLNQKKQLRGMNG